MAIWSRFFGGAASTAAGFGVGSALGPTLAPITQDIANEVWAAYPNRPLAASAAAELAARGFWTYPQAADEALLTGVKLTRADALAELATHPPTLGELLELRNRGAIGDPGLDAGLEQSGLRAQWRAPVKALRFVLAPVSDLVRMAVREAFDPGQRAALDLDAEFPDAFAARAAELGMSRGLAADYWAAHWELPSAEQGFEMYHRKLLDGAGLDRLLRALDYAPTWRSRLRSLAERIPPITDMIRFAVREVYDPAQRAALGLDSDYPDQFTDEAALHGMSAERARQYWAAHWRLPSPEQAYRMLHRGLISEPELLGLLKALDYPEKWRERLNAIAHLVPGRIDLRRMFAAGVIDRAAVKAGYIRLGYTDLDAERLTELAVELASGGTDSSVSKAENQLWASLHRSYMNVETDDPTAQRTLAEIGVTGTTQARVLELWRLERDLIRRTLTPAQLVKAYKKVVTNPATGVAWTREDVLAELEALGYSDEDAAVFLDESL